MRRVSCAVALVLAFLMAGPQIPATGRDEPASVAPQLGPDWSLEAGPRGSVLVYTHAERLPLRNARPEFRDGDRLLGYPQWRGSRMELALSPSTLASLESPAAWLSGRRLDGPTPHEAFPSAPPEQLPLARRALRAERDPGERGPYATETLSYELPDLPLAGYEVPLEVLAEVIAPVGAAGARPLILFLHGAHDTCYSLTPLLAMEGGWPCPEGTLPVPSHQGYRYVAALLASQGYLTVSISANAINAQDNWMADTGMAARSALIRHHLARWVEWTTIGGDPWGGRFLGGVDLGRVVLVGHSRGGEGVERAALDSTAADGYRIVGLVPIAPTAFGRQVGTGIPTMVLLPYCDGDVSDLQGQQYVDQSRDLIPDRALRSAVLVMGANHNFFNTEWTPGLSVAPAIDDWGGEPDDPVCGSEGAARLTPEEQQAVGATYIAALVAVAVEREAAAATLLDGTRVRAESAGRARVLAHALGGHRRLVYRPRFSDVIATTGLSAVVCRGHTGESWPPLGGTLVSDCYRGAAFERLPHWLAMMDAESAPSPRALDLQWWRSGGTARIQLNRARDMSRATHLDVRLAVDSSSPAVELDLRLVDRRGAVVDLPAASALRALPGDEVPLGKIWAQTLRFDLTPARSGIDLTAIAGIELVSRSGRGRAWLIDIHTRRPGLAQATAHRLPQFGVTSAEIPEGGPGIRTEYLPLEIRGELLQPATLWVSLAGPDGPMEGYRLVLPAGATAAAIPLTVEGNDQFDKSIIEYRVTLKALSAATTGSYRGTLTVVEDDPPPTLTWEATTVRVAEGGTLAFTATLSAPLSIDLWYWPTLGEVSGRPTLFTDDVAPGFLLQWSSVIPDPPEPLWLSVFPHFLIPAGSTTATFEIPTVADGIEEGREYITVTLSGRDDPLLPIPITVRGIVRDS